jgi:hypothetical protein
MLKIPSKHKQDLVSRATKNEELHSSERLLTNWHTTTPSSFYNVAVFLRKMSHVLFLCLDSVRSPLISLFSILHSAFCIFLTVFSWVAGAVLLGVPLHEKSYVLAKREVPMRESVQKKDCRVVKVQLFVLFCCPFLLFSLRKPSLVLLPVLLVWDRVLTLALSLTRSCLSLRL